MKKMMRRFMAAITTAALFAAGLIQTLPAAAATMHTIYYSAGDVDNMVSSSTFMFAVPENCSFEYCDSSRFSRKGYKITSWYVQETGQTVGVQQPSFMPSYDLHVTANWEPVKYDICLAGVGGTTASGEKNIYVEGTYGTWIDLPYNPFTKDGYTFAGWDYEGTRYSEGESFEVPAVLAGSRIVLAAVWTDQQAAVTTTAPTETVTTTTTTTTTTAAATIAADRKSKVFYPDNASFRSVNETFNIYISDIVGRYDELDSMTFVFEADSDKLGSVSAGFATVLLNGETYQQNFVEYVNGDTFSMTVDKDICSQLNYNRFFRFQCWQSGSYPLELIAVKTVVKENAFTTTTEEETTTTTTTTTTTEATTTSETTTTTTTTEETTTTTTTPETTMTTTTTTTAPVQPTLKGDADLDGKVSLTDIVVVSKNSLSSTSYPLVNETAFANADMNSDKAVNGLDTSTLIEINLGSY